MGGKQSRGKGNRGELRACAMFNDLGLLPYPVVTTRKASGNRLGDDLCFQTGPKTFAPMPISVEVKAVEKFQPTDWITQAVEQAGDRPWMVLWIPAYTRQGREWVITEHPGGWHMQWWEQYASRLFTMEYATTATLSGAAD